MDTNAAGQGVGLIVSGSELKTLGSVIMPVILKTDTGERIKLKFYALVVPKLIIPMFISNSSLSDLGVFMYLGMDLELDTGNEKFTIPHIPFRRQDY